MTVFERAIETYGKENQIDVAIEEMSELMKALVKMNRCQRRGNGGEWACRANIIEEIADVEIMMDQLKLIYDCSGAVEVVKHMKKERLEKRLEMGEFTRRLWTLTQEK